MTAEQTGRAIGMFLALLAVIIFVVAAIGELPSDWEGDAEPIPVGLAFLAGGFVFR